MHSMTMIWFLIGMIFIQSAVSIDAELTLSQLEKMVADLKRSHQILSRKISEIQFENIKVKFKTSKMRIEHKRKPTIN